MTNYRFIPIDEAARHGSRLLKADDETLHAGRWSPALGRWVYSSGFPIDRTITHYSARTEAAIGGAR